MHAHADELEPYVTLRGHRSPVLALALKPQDRTQDRRVLFSAGTDFHIRAWYLPDPRVFNAYSSNLTAQQNAMRAGCLVGHNDNVWSLQHHPHGPRLLSASSDGCVGVWGAEGGDGASDGGHLEQGAMQASFELRALRSDESTREASAEQRLDVPAAAVWMPTDVTKFLAGYTSARLAVFDVKCGTLVLDLPPPAPAAANSQTSPSTAASLAVATRHAGGVTSLCCHGVMTLAAVGHVDCCARLVDLVSGRYVATLAEHPAVVTSVSIDANGTTLVTGCHDGRVRSYDLRTGRCLQSLRFHWSKYDEAVHCVSQTATMLASGGADGNVVASMLPL